jgi:hypothetical protein
MPTKWQQKAVDDVEKCAWHIVDNLGNLIAVSSPDQ